MIAKCENTGTGEATVVVQATSVGVETGFYVKGVMLYIKDPEGDGDVAIPIFPSRASRSDEAPRQPGKQDGDFQHHQHCGRSGERFGHHRRTPWPAWWTWKSMRSWATAMKSATFPASPTP